MKRLAVLAAFLLLAADVFAGSPYFCTREGAKMHYARRSAAGRLVWTYDSVVLRADAERIDFTWTFKRPGGSVMYGGPVKVSLSLNEGGDMELDVAATVKSLVNNLFPRVEVKSEGGLTVLPSTMAPGDALPDVNGTAEVLGMKYRVHYDGRRVLRRETLNLPAGEFDCLVVEEHKVESGLGRNRDIRTLTWYSAGIGEIRHESYDWKSGKLLTVEVLESVEYDGIVG